MPNSEPDAASRTAVVTGASSGLGVAIAEALGALGYDVAIGARRSDRLAETASRIEEAGGRAFAHALDVSDPASIDAFFDAVEAHWRAPDVIINNAGMSTPGPLHTLPADSITNEVATNLIGPMHVARRALRPMLAARRRGDLVFISSDAVRNPRPQQSVYTATKTGLEGFVRALGMELEGTGVRCTTVRPGPTFSEYAARWPHEQIVGLLEFWRRYGLQRHGGVMPADAVARAVVLAVTTPPGVHLDTLEVQPEAPMLD